MAVSAAEFCAAVERRLGNRCPDRWISFPVKAAGKILEVYFADRKEASYAAQRLRPCPFPPDCRPDARVICWRDSVEEYIGSERAKARWRFQDDSGYVMHFASGGLSCGNYSNRRFYCCDDREELGMLSETHILRGVFYQWALTEQLFTLHAAAVGWDGRGVLIAGQSGGGKSALTVSCLLSGLEVAGDDYVLVPAEGAWTAYPLYSTLSLQPDLYKTGDMPLPVLGKDARGKVILQAGNCLYDKGLEIQCLMTISWGAETPQIVPAEKGPAIVRIVQSTLHQAGCSWDREQVRRMAGRLSTLPAYEFRQSNNFRENAQMLRCFITEEFCHV